MAGSKRRRVSSSSSSSSSSSESMGDSAMDRARAVQAKLSRRFPSFVKLMRVSHVSEQFRLCLPKLFCDEHLPKHDGVIVLLDENHKWYNGRYSVERYELTGGWRCFSTDNKLLEGDFLVFQLIELCKFKVYIVKNTRLTKVNDANRDHFHRKPVKEEEEEENSDPIEVTRDKYLEHLSRKKERSIPVRKPARDEYAYYSDRFGTKRSSEYSLVRFKDVKGFKDFRMYVDGQILDSEIPTRCRAKYYELCKSQNMFLHEKLVRGLNGKLAAGMISETVKIADAIRAVNSMTCPARMDGWDKTLKGFEELGMVVGFLRVRIRKLLRVFREFRDEIDLKRIERDEAEKEMRALNAKIGKIDAEIDALSGKNEPVFKEIACAPW
ncbi:hypothetical protein ABFS83_14G108600 [Erythranthe nasuta]